MKLQIDRTSFFGRSSSHSATTTAISRDVEQGLHQAQSAWVIQRWWKQLHLKKTAAESFDYVHGMVSLEQAQQDSFTKLEKFLLDPKTISTTRKLLMHLEQTKDIVLPTRMSLSNVYKAERQFLTAYMIATKSTFIFESPTDIDELLLARAQEMLKSFEELCTFMSEIYLKDESAPTSPLADSTPSADRVFSNLDGARMNEDDRFITEGRDYLDAFHKKQMAYYETFTEWEAKNRYKLAKILIDKYLEIEAKRFTVLNSLDPRMLELYEGYGKQQETLKRRVSSLLGEEGRSMLAEGLTKLQAALEAKKWVSSPSEALIHELVLNPKLLLSAEACAIGPQKNINAAITALVEKTPNTELILDVLEEVRNNLGMFTPNNRQQLHRLQQNFSRTMMKSQIDTLGLHSGLYTIISSFFEQIKLLESPAHVRETNYYLTDLTRRLSEPGDASHLLREAIDYIYSKMSQINLELKNFQIKQSRDLVASNIVALEQTEFQTRLSKKQFNLDFTLMWVDKFVSSPAEYRLDLSILCSKYLGSYASHALMIGILQQPQNSVLHTIPETFYLDRLRLVKWHAQYQNLLYTVTALGYLETFCQDHDLKLSPEELVEEKKRLLTALETGTHNTPKEKADDLAIAINRLLEKQKKELTLIDKNTLTSLIEKCCEGSNQVSKLINKRLGDQLSYYFFKGRMPESSIPLVRRYGLETEINKLGKEILPVLRLHNKVHGAFYQQEVEQRLWKPLFATLRQTGFPTALPSLLAPEEESIKKTRAYMHKLAFVLSGLALIQQSVVYSDMWKINLTIKNTQLKELASTFGLIEMIKSPSVTKAAIETKLMELMQHVATEYELPYETEDKAKMARMLGLAKQEKSLGSKAFLDELTSLTKHYVIEGKETINPNNLVAEFREEVAQIRTNTKELTKQIKTAHTPEEIDPITATIPLLHAGRTLEEARLGMK